MSSVGNGSMYQQGMSYGLMGSSGGQMLRAQAPPQQYNGPRPPYGTPPSPGRGSLLYLNGAPPRPAGPPGPLNVSVPAFAPAGRSMSSSGQAPPPGALPRSISQPMGYGPRTPFSPSAGDSFPRLRDGEEQDPFPALGAQRTAAAVAATPPPGMFPAAAVAARAGARPKESDFSMMQDDFPALPGTKSAKSPDSLMEGAAPRWTEEMPAASESDFEVRPAAEEDPTEGYGLLGLLGVVRMSFADRSALAIGTDLTTLGLNLGSPDVLYTSFLSPWMEPGRKEATTLPPALAAPPKAPLAPALQRMQMFPDETLFYIFYSMPSDVLQQYAASYLYARDWRYHKEHKVWITKAHNAETQKMPNGERGVFVYFDPSSWKRVPKEMFLQYDMLEERRAPPGS